MTGKRGRIIVTNPFYLPLQGVDGTGTEEITANTVWVARLEGFEPPTPGSEDRCSIH